MVVYWRWQFLLALFFILRQQKAVTQIIIAEIAQYSNANDARKDVFGNITLENMKN